MVSDRLFGAAAGRLRGVGVAVLLATVGVASMAGTAWAGDPDPIFAEAGIHYPDGFDLNTLGDVRGRVVRVEPGDKGPVRVEVDAGSDRYTVLASPQWYWDDVKPGLSPGDRVVVRGSKSLGTNGRLYVVAQELRVSASGRKVTFRDPSGGPLWMGARPRGAASRRGSMGAGMGGMGGMGSRGGMGGMGHR